MSYLQDPRMNAEGFFAVALKRVIAIVVTLLRTKKKNINDKSQRSTILKEGYICVPPSPTHLGVIQN